MLKQQDGITRGQAGWWHYRGEFQRQPRGWQARSSDSRANYACGPARTRRPFLNTMNSNFLVTSTTPGSITSSLTAHGRWCWRGQTAEADLSNPDIRSEVGGRSLRSQPSSFRKLDRPVADIRCDKTPETKVFRDIVNTAAPSA